MTDNEIIKALECCADDSVIRCEECLYGVSIFSCRQMQLKKDSLDLINRQKAELENQSENFKVLVSDHRTLQQSFDNLKGLYEAEKARVEKAKEKSIYFAKELQTAKAELKETTEKFNCQQYVYADLSDIIRDKNAEIKKLQADNSSMQSTLAKMSMGVEQAKAKAIKEFAEAFKVKFAKERYRDNYVIDDEMLDNFVKEMVGEG